jgi:predicted ester cyclase
MSENKKMVKLIYSWWQSWSEDNAAKMHAAMRDDFISHVPDFEIQGFSQYVGMMNWYSKHFVDAKYELHDLIEENDKVVARHTVQITYKGGWHDIPSTDQRIYETGINIFRFQDGRLAEMWCQMSDLSVYNQLKPL